MYNGREADQKVGSLGFQLMAEPGYWERGVVSRLGPGYLRVDYTSVSS